MRHKKKIKDVKKLRAEDPSAKKKKKARKLVDKKLGLLEQTLAELDL